MGYYCNPINVPYRYQFNRNSDGDAPLRICREAADPSLIRFHGKYYIFASMNLSVWISEDLVTWRAQRLPADLPLYDYAPDARVIGDYVYLCASSRDHICDYYRTKDIEHGPYERIPGTFAFWDPDLFLDDDGRVYFYWGCSNETPIYGVELDPETLRPIGERTELLYGAPEQRGYERVGDNNSRMGKPYIEGAWMTRYQGRYYLQYACPGAEYTTYADGVLVADAPLGPFRAAKDNPFSCQPGGFIPGAGHGSTMQDGSGRWWHTSTESISVNHIFERRVGIWPAGFDADGVLFCNQRYGDWPIAVSEEGGQQDPWREPSWYLLSYGKRASASSSQQGHEPMLAVNEDVHNWWRPETADRGEWLLVDLGGAFDVRAVQINFADDRIDLAAPGTIHGGPDGRYIEERDNLCTQWLLETSLDGEHWSVLDDKSRAQTDLPHDLVVRPEGFQARFLRLSHLKVPYGQIPCISGLRVFGRGQGDRPCAPVFRAVRTGDLDMEVRIRDGVTDPEAPQRAAAWQKAAGHNGASVQNTEEQGARSLGFNILWGTSKDKLYHSFLVFAGRGLQENRRQGTIYETDDQKAEVILQRIGALVKGQREYWVRVDAFNENGITEGNCLRVSGGGDGCES